MSTEKESRMYHKCGVDVIAGSLTLIPFISYLYGIPMSFCLHSLNCWNWEQNVAQPENISRLILLWYCCKKESNNCKIFLGSLSMICAITPHVLYMFIYLVWKSTIMENSDRSHWPQQYWGNGLFGWSHAIP